MVEGSRRRAEATAEIIKADIWRGKYGVSRPGKAILFEVFAKDYLNLYSKQNKRSWKRDEVSLKNLKPFFRGKHLSEINPELIEKYKLKRRGKVKEATINRELALLKTMFNKAIEWGKVGFNPVKKVKLFKENNIKERILNNDEINRLLKTAEEIKESYLKLFLIIALNTGMRRMEILSLKWENVNLAKRFILIENSKSGKSRKVPMNQIVIDTLKRVERANEYIFFNLKTKTHIKDIKTSFKSSCEKAKIDNLRIHDLRHTCASRMIEAGIDVVTTSKILGHSDIKMTLRYCHPTQENMLRAVDKLGEIFQKPRHKVVTQENMIEVKKPVTSSYLYN